MLFHPRTSAVSLLLGLLSSTTVVDSATWRGPSSIIVPTSKVSPTPLHLLLRGGTNDDDPTRSPILPTLPANNHNVNNNVNNNNSNHVVARGGSTTTKNHLYAAVEMPLAVPITQPTTAATGSVHTTTDSSTATSTSKSTSSLVNATTTTAAEAAAAAAAAHGPTNSHAVNTTASVTTAPTTMKTQLPSPTLTPPLTKREEKKAAKEAKKELKRHQRIAKKLKNRNATNLRRKVMHATFGFAFATLNHLIPKSKFVTGMVVLTSATLLLELLRYRKRFEWMNDIMHKILGSSLRKHEMDGKFTGSFYYFLGVTLTSALYPTSCATLGICQLAIADPTASYFGRATRHVYWSRIENGLGGVGRNKGVLGFLGGALACAPMNYALLSQARFATLPTTSSLWIASLALGLAGAFADLAVPTPTLTLPKKVLGVKVPPFHVDDNVVVPVFSGWACLKIFQLVGYPTDLALAKYLIW